MIMLLFLWRKRLMMTIVGERAKSSHKNEHHALEKNQICLRHSIESAANIWIILVALTTEKHRAEIPEAIIADFCGRQSIAVFFFTAELRNFNRIREQIMSLFWEMIEGMAVIGHTEQHKTNAACPIIRQITVTLLRCRWHILIIVFIMNWIGHCFHCPLLHFHIDEAFRSNILPDDTISPPLSLSLYPSACHTSVYDGGTVGRNIYFYERMHSHRRIIIFIYECCWSEMRLCSITRKSPFNLH